MAMGQEAQFLDSYRASLISIVQGAHSALGAVRCPLHSVSRWPRDGEKQKAMLQVPGGASILIESLENCCAPPTANAKAASSQISAPPGPTLPRPGPVAGHISARRGPPWRRRGAASPLKDTINQAARPSAPGQPGRGGEGGQGSNLDAGGLQ